MPVSTKYKMKWLYSLQGRVGGSNFLRTVLVNVKFTATDGVHCNKASICIAYFS